MWTKPPGVCKVGGGDGVRRLSGAAASPIGSGDGVRRPALMAGGAGTQHAGSRERKFVCVHHIQRISHGIAMEDAKQINRRIACLKQRAYRTSRRS